MHPKLKDESSEELYLALRMNDKWRLKRYLRARVSHMREGQASGLEWLDGKIAESELFRPWKDGGVRKDNYAVQRGKEP